MKKHFLIFTLLLCSLFAQAQDFSFSQFYEQPLLRNPALAGVFEGDIRASGIFRNQWQSVTVPYRTGAASVEVKFPITDKIWLTTGAQTTYDEAGDIRLKRSSLMPVLNGHVLLDEAGDFLSVAVMGGPVSNQFDPTQAKYGDQWVNGSYDPNNTTAQQFSRTGMNYFDGSAGFALNGNIGDGMHYYVGAGFYHFNRPKVAFYTTNYKTFLNPKMSITTGIKTETSDNNTLEFYADYYAQAGHHQFIGGLLYGTILQEETEDINNKKAIYFGGLYRYNDALIPVVKLDVYRFGIGLSYDVNISKLTTASNSRGGFELSLNYRATLTNRSAYLDRTKCPGRGL